MAEPAIRVMKENRDREMETGPTETREQAILATAGVASQAIEAEGSQVKQQTRVLNGDLENAIASQPHLNMFALQHLEVDEEEELEKQPQNGTKPNLQDPKKEITTRWDHSPATQTSLEVDESGDSLEPQTQRPWKGKGVLMPWSDPSAVLPPPDPLRDDSIPEGVGEPCAGHSTPQADQPHIDLNYPDTGINSFEQVGSRRSRVFETFDPFLQPDVMTGISSSLSSQLGRSVRSRSSIHYLSPLTGIPSRGMTLISSPSVSSSTLAQSLVVLTIPPETHDHPTNPTLTNDGRPMMYPAVQRVYRKPRQRIRYMCHECDVPLLQAQTCSKCGHQRCDQCRRRP